MRSILPSQRRPDADRPEVRDSHLLPQILNVDQMLYVLRCEYGLTCVSVIVADVPLPIF